MKRLIALIPAILLIAGCMSVTKTEGTRIDRSKVLELKPGATTRQAVIAAFGTPTEISYENNEEKMVYSFREKKMPAYFGGLVENEALRKEAVTSLELVFRNDVVWSYRFKSSEN
ncbi:MAG: hypothetical protein A2054_10545 [Deltaproteobacteria bacterium GWA2_55_10]|nr:MAG: hypothetical protein A2054_10545 [Deltaproteobacteria bacterium GWA2_55_10]